MNPLQVLEVGSGGGQGPERITPWHGDLVTSPIIVGVTYRWPRGRNAAARLHGSESRLGDLPVRARGACGRAAGKPRRHRLTRSATLERRLAGPTSARGPITQPRSPPHATCTHELPLWAHTSVTNRPLITRRGHSVPNHALCLEIYSVEERRKSHTATRL